MRRKESRGAERDEPQKEHQRPQPDQDPLNLGFEPRIGCHALGGDSAAYHLSVLDAVGLAAVD